MRILLISDIHANLEALEACLKAAPAHDYVFNLGDVVGYGASPNEVTVISRELGKVFVRGNHDKACTGVTGVQDFNATAATAALWTMHNLKPDNLEWLSKLPAGPIHITELPVGEPAGNDGAAPEAAQRQTLAVPLECVHGSPIDEDEYLLDLKDAVGSLVHQEALITFFGHSHIQGAFSGNGAEWMGLRPDYKTDDDPETFEMGLRKDYRYLINPGSIGQPRDNDWRAAFALYDTEAGNIIFHRVPYDIKTTQKKIMDAKLPERLAIRLQIGR